MGFYLQKGPQAQSLGKRMRPATPKKTITRASQRTKQTMVNEISNSAMSLNASNTVPKQVLHLVDVTNSVDNLSYYYKRQLELDTLITTSPTKCFQTSRSMEFWFMANRTHAELSVISLNILTSWTWSSMVNSNLTLIQCQSDWLQQQSVKIVGKVVVTCAHADTTKRCVFYVTDLNDMKILLGLTFARHSIWWKYYVMMTVYVRGSQWMSWMNFQQDWTSQNRRIILTCCRLTHQIKAKL